MRLESYTRIQFQELLNQAIHNMGNLRVTLPVNNPILTNMKRVTLQFPNVKILWSFAKILKVQEFQINTEKFQLVCYCEESLIEEALTFYKGKMIADPRQTNDHSQKFKTESKK